MTEGWELIRGARGKPVTHHVTFTLLLPSGDRLRTRISRPVNGDTYGARLFADILREQLQVTKAEFWQCVRQGVAPNRGAPSQQLPKNALPLKLTVELTRLGVDAATLATLDTQSAEVLLVELYEKD
ncbi:MAG: cytotoxic translational repressor of toxin-antitoxin stability system [Gulosibacter sp.]|uniref:cytotoxic translational repressor of toxin-antitoxin stability system n=1 Tax=Gulosibacter sp. TaxID=2817531 RepID=UPI003F930191